MTRRKTANGLDFEALRLGIECCDPNILLGFYADDARLSIVYAQAQRSIPFELRGKAEIGKYLRAVFDQKMPHHVERGVVGEDRVTFREACEYPEGGQVVVETTLELRDGMIVRQVDVVAKDVRADSEEASGRRPLTRKNEPQSGPRMDEHPTGDLS